MAAAGMIREAALERGVPSGPPPAPGREFQAAPSRNRNRALGGPVPCCGSTCPNSLQPVPATLACRDRPLRGDQPPAWVLKPVRKGPVSDAASGRPPPVAQSVAESAKPREQAALSRFRLSTIGQNTNRRPSGRFTRSGQRMPARFTHRGDQDRSPHSERRQATQAGR
jgi:hypothetical protein